MYVCVCVCCVYVCVLCVCVCVVCVCCAQRGFSDRGRGLGTQAIVFFCEATFRIFNLNLIVLKYLGVWWVQLFGRYRLLYI